MGVITTGHPPGGQRLILAESLPLNSPLVLQVFPIYACNLKCSYCHMSIPQGNREFVTDEPMLDEKLFDVWMSECQQFAKMIRVIRFVGMGEPLLHPKITDMIYTVHKYCIAEKIELLTNGVNLNPNFAWDLPRLGLTKMIISVQGIRSEDYVMASGGKFDFDGFIRHLDHVYQYKRDMQIHIKGIDCTIDDEQKFYDTFLPFCDTISIEKVGPIYRGVEDNKKNPLGDETQYKAKRQKVTICPMPFVSMQVNPDGKVVPCYATEYPCFIGDCNKESLFDIWHGEKLREFRLRMLDGREKASANCVSCKMIDHRMYKQDSLEGHGERLKEVYR